MKKILQKDANDGKVLRQKAKEVPVRDIPTLKIKKILREMSSALRSQGDGVAIAAPQIGYPLRIFVVSGKIFEEGFEKMREDGATETITTKKQKDLIFINPKISKLSKDKEWVAEGCLSVRWLYGKTFRAKKALITAYDEKGKKFTRGGSGLLAQIFQHETDHLNGVLFTDHAKEIKEDPPKE